MKQKKLLKKERLQSEAEESGKAASENRVNLIINWFFLAILAGTPLILVPSLQNSAILSKYIFSIYGLSFIIALWCFQTAKSGKIDKIPFGMGIPFLVFGLLWLVPSLFKSNRLLSLYAGLPMLFWLGGAFILSHYLNQQKKITCLVGAIIFGGSLCALYGLMQYLNLDFFHLKWLGRKMIGKQIMISTFGNANFFAAYIAPVFFLILGWMVLPSVKSKWRITGIILLIVLAACILLSGVRSAWVSLPLSLLAGFLILIFRKSSKKEKVKTPFSWKLVAKWGSISLFLLMIIAGTLNKYQIYKTDWLKTRIQSLSNIHELEERFLIWQVSMQMIRENPITGIGTGNFPAGFFPQLAKFISHNSTQGEYNAVLTFIGGRNANHSHNDYLQISAETGLPALGVFFWIIIFFSYFQVKAIRRSTDWEWKIRQTALFCATIPFWIDMMVSFPQYLPANGLLFWSLIGIAIAHLSVDNSIEGNEPQTRSINQIGKLLVAGAGIITLAAGLWYGTTQVISGYEMKKGLYNLQHLQGKEALDSFATALKYNPAIGNAYLLVGKLYGVSGMLEPSLQMYAAAAALGTDDITVYEDPAAFLYLKGDYRRAADMYQTILTFYPTHPAANKQLAVIYSKYIPDRDKAVFHIEKYLATNPPVNEKEWFQKTLEELKKVQ